MSITIADSRTPDGPSTIDDETLARALLSHCTDGPDPFMESLMLACRHGLLDGAWDIWQSISEERRYPSPGSGPAARRLEEAFARVIRRSNNTHRDAVAGIRSRFRARCSHWTNRASRIPSEHRDGQYAWLSMDGDFWLMAPHHPCWPDRLNDLALHGDSQTPLCLWGRGRPEALSTCGHPIAIVGSREADESGRRTTYALSRAVSGQGHLVISGGAIGIDVCAHRAALAVDRNLLMPADDGTLPNPGSTLAVFAGGLRHIGPARNRDVFAQMLAQGGALISELSPETIPDARRFLVRNRIIAALSGTVVIVQARTRSGALNTAHWANTLCREVYAIPGSIETPHHAGCNALIRDHQAEALLNAEELLGSITHRHRSAPQGRTGGSSSEKTPVCRAQLPPVEARLMGIIMAHSHHAGGLHAGFVMTLANESCVRKRPMPAGKATLGALRPEEVFSGLGSLESRGLIRIDEQGLITCGDTAS
ncbi:MAG: DNA-processing protein DprA [Bifidobacterium psychraerophilum]|uniref:DNA-processing protein DprA n=1 Tax=Bifidobacterium psychraerophilum TaxID=218140 RepID=UPI0039E95866